MASTEASVDARRGRREGVGANEPAARPAPLRTPSPSELAFPGCDRIPMTLAEYRRREYPIELWDAASRTAWRLRDGPTWEHEGPSQTLGEMAALIAAARGSPIKCFGAMGVVRHGDTGRKRLVLHPDQTVYLHPGLVEQEFEDPLLVVGRTFPDVVLEVDHTTDVRPGKLRLYESWGVPEFWVEVPDRKPRSRPAGLVPGLTIRLLDAAGAYRVSPVSRAFLGWRAEDIHEAMNEIVPSAKTFATVERLGRRLGAREGTGPDDNPFLRSLRGESREEGHARGLAEGLAEGRAAGMAEGLKKGRAAGQAEARAKMVRRILSSRGIEVSARFPADAPGFAESAEDEAVAIALACDNEADFRKRIR